jgi:hypothetical protein
MQASQIQKRKGMQMKSAIRAALAAALGVMAMAASTGALAHERGKHERHGSHQGHGWGHAKHAHHAYHHHEVYRQRIVFHQPPPVIYEHRAYYDPPAIVIGVDIPPLVIRLR